MRRFLILLFLLVLMLSGCSRFTINRTGTIRIKGSTTMLPFTQRWAQEYMKKYNGVSVYVDGGGTPSGAQALAKGEIDICAASRPLLPKEVQVLAQNHNTVGISIIVGKDALSIYVNKDNPVKNLTLAQLKKIYKGDITNWKEVGGEDHDIQLINKTPNSGTFLYFQDHVLDGESFGTNSLFLSTYGQIVNAVANNPSAIGYGGLGFKNIEENVSLCHINGIEPSVENVQNNSYPITRYLYLYTVSIPKGQVRHFINWALGKSGQDIVKEAGYIPVWGDEK